MGYYVDTSVMLMFQTILYPVGASCTNHRQCPVVRIWRLCGVDVLGAEEQPSPIECPKGFIFPSLYFKHFVSNYLFLFIWVFFLNLSQGFFVL